MKPVLYYLAGKISTDVLQKVALQVARTAGVLYPLVVAVAPGNGGGGGSAAAAGAHDVQRVAVLNKMMAIVATSWMQLIGPGPHAPAVATAAVQAPGAGIGAAEDRMPGNEL
ncbi:unnamed protein product, partial [Phaeothamnion confervicola]